MYRGMMRQDYGRILKRITIDDGIGGSISVFDPLIERYHCRIWRQRAERDRRDQANVEDTGWGILGDDAPISEGDKYISLRDAREFIFTRVWNEVTGRARAHLEGTMRLVSP